MNPASVLSGPARLRVFDWAARRHEPVSLSLNRAGEWVLLRSHFVAVDADGSVMRIAYPMAEPNHDMFEIVAGEPIGVAFRRGHKKCIFSSVVAGREQTSDGLPCILLRLPEQVQEFQRRSFQRAVIAPGQLYAVRLWRKRGPDAEGASGLLCVGRLRDLSAGGMQMEIDAAHDPYLRGGDVVRIELRFSEHGTPLFVDGAYRHATAIRPGVIGLGLQFIGLELTAEGRRTLQALCEVVSKLRKPARGPYFGRRRGEGGPRPHAGGRQAH